MGNFGFAEIVVVAAVVFVLFGAKRIPDFARSLGQGLRIFKAEVNPKDSPPTKPSESK